MLLVTSDKGFYKNRAYEMGLATNLAAEAQATKCGITIVHELSAVLQRVRADITIDYGRLGDQFLSRTREQIQDWVGRQGFVISDLVSGTHKLFATDDPAHAHLEFELSYRCVHPDDREGTLVVHGEGTYSPTTGTAGELHRRGEEFQYADTDGQRKSISAIVMVGGVTIGHRTVHHEVRVPLDIGR